MNQQRKNYNIGPEEEWSFRFARTIVDILKDGVPQENLNFMDKVKFFDALPGDISTKIREFHEKFDHGVDMRVRFVCNNCEYETDRMILNMNNSFFMPTRV